MNVLWSKLVAVTLVVTVWTSSSICLCGVINKQRQTALANGPVHSCCMHKDRAEGTKPPQPGSCPRCNLRQQSDKTAPERSLHVNTIHLPIHFLPMQNAVAMDWVSQARFQSSLPGIPILIPQDDLYHRACLLTI